MKISKLAVVALFAAGFITTGASAGMAADTPSGLLDCAKGYQAVYSEDGFSGSCEAIPDFETITPTDTCWQTEDGIDVCASVLMTKDLTDPVSDCAEGYIPTYTEDGSLDSCVVKPDIETIKPINSCWETEDGVNVCARGLVSPPKTDVEITPYDAPVVCASPEDPASADLADCKTPMLYDSTDVTGAEPMPVDDAMIPLNNVKADDPTLMYQSGMPMAASSTGNSSSNTLAALGVLIAALGALGIGISKQRASAK